MTDFCLVNPPHPYLVDPDAQMALGLLYVAAAARRAGFRVAVANLSAAPVEGAAARLPDAPVYGVTATAVDLPAVNALARDVKRAKPGAKVVVGGPVWLCPEYLTPDVDCVVRGEAEGVIGVVMADGLSGRLRAAYDGAPADVDDVAAPARDLWPGPLGGRVFMDGRGHFPGGSAVLSTSRGCPFACTFCASPRLSGGKVRLRNVEAVVAEMEAVVVDHGVRQFRFSDEHLTVTRARVEGLADGVLRSAVLAPGGRAGIAWRASVRAKPNDPAMFRAMRRAGCREVSVGVESADPAVLELLDKRITPDDARAALANARDAGIGTRALFMVGTPGETERTPRMNAAFWRSGAFDRFALTLFAPLPGTEVRRHPEKFRCAVLHPEPWRYNLCQRDREGERAMEPHVRLWDLDHGRFRRQVAGAFRLARSLPNLNHG